VRNHVDDQPIERHEPEIVKLDPERLAHEAVCTISSNDVPSPQLPRPEGLSGAERGASCRGQTNMVAMVGDRGDLPAGEPLDFRDRRHPPVKHPLQLRLREGRPSRLRHS
jgi:hypothetical protein